VIIGDSPEAAEMKRLTFGAIREDNLLSWLATRCIWAASRRSCAGGQLHSTQDRASLRCCHEHQVPLDHSTTMTLWRKSEWQISIMVSSAISS